MMSVSFDVTVANCYMCIPKCERGFRFSIDVSNSRKLLAYPAGNVIAVCELPDLGKAHCLYGHKETTTAVRFSPSSKLLASGDEKGMLIIWDLETMKEKQSLPIFGSTICDIAWIDDEKIFVCGSGKGQFIMGMLFDQKKKAGEMLHHTQKVSCIDATKTEPYYVISGSEDQTVGVFKGIPFVLEKSFKEHTNYVNDVRFSPSGELFASGSGDRRLLIFSTKDMAFVKELKDEKNGHKGSIMNIFWINEDTLFTGSMDKTCKIWDVKSSTVVASMSAKEEKSQAINDMTHAITCFDSSMLFSVTLDGHLNIWDKPDLNSTELNLPKRVIQGHQGKITALHYGFKSQFLFSGDSEGTVCIWKEKEGLMYATESRIHKGTILDLKEACDGNVWAAGIYNMIYKIDSEKATQIHAIKVETMPIQIAASATNPEVLYLLLKDSNLLKIEGGTIKETHKVCPNATALEINEEAGEIYIGDKKGNIHVLALADLKELATLNEYPNEITCISYHPKTKLLAATDRLKLLYVYDISARKIIGLPLSGHNGAVWRCSWSPEGTYLASASLDFAVAIWKPATKPRQKVILDRIHSLGATAVAFKSEDVLFCAGNDGVIKKLQITSK